MADILTKEYAMELEDLKRIWKEYEAKLDASLSLNRRVMRDALLGKAETKLRRLSHWIWVELALSLVAVVWLGSFVWTHLGEPRFLLPAVALQAATTLLAVACVRQLMVLAKLDYAGPLVELQRGLERLRVQRIRTSQWTFLLAPLAWLPVLIVLAEDLLAIDIYRATTAQWLWANLLFGVLVLAAGVWLVRRYADRFESSPVLRKLLRDLAGHNLASARGFLQSLEEFEEV